ncbi:electron transfer flavoprotein subunit alpha/FixB family protein [Anaeromyxobacter paludicola]|uniref:Electron transfer flavoprotein alpha/beta-subunit N-terminal domain-containing protein n=1 Tax=Anaeromyxobacter paludicola TaxID=2918171 RepID=A0ABM7X6T7_9BACT|nr:electron transfer flavoprotein subunit alpha [Anaeromyxobacter paludicola]BDG07552.1 hypothetical protein AMPC_06650 [Anaeromyxobacter paludicola]
MEKVLFIAHPDADGALPRAALEALSAARALATSLGAPLTVGLFGADLARAAAAVAGAGADAVLAADAPELAAGRAAADGAACEALCRAAQATLVVAPGTSRTARAFPGAAFRLGGKVDTHATALAASGGAVALTRWFYKQRIEARLTRAERPWLVLLDGGCAPAHVAEGSAPALQAVPLELGEAARRTRVEGVRAPAADAQTIRPDAKLLFVAGAGWTKKQKDGQPHPAEAEALILGFLKASKASLGSSKSLVDQTGEGQAVLGFMSHLNQVGQTGSTPRHPKGLATCCHGEEPHVVGWRFVHERRAVNLDPACGWARGKADVLYVADAFEVVRELNALLAAKGG